MITLLIDDHPIFREGLRGIVARGVPATSILEGGSAAQLQQYLANGVKPDLLVLDLLFPGFDYKRDLPRIRLALPLTTLVVVSMLEDDATIEFIMACGANGYICKSADAGNMSAAFARIVQGEIVQLRSGDTDTTVKPLGERQSEFNQLSPRQHEVLLLLAQGLSNKEIGRILGISPFTVRVHVSSIFEALGVSSRAAAASMAERNRLI